MMRRFNVFAMFVSLGLLAQGMATPAILRGAESDFNVEVSLPSVNVDKPLNDLFSRQWVRSDASGRVNGTLVQLTDKENLPVEGLLVALVRDGKVAYAGKSDKDGNFSYEGVTPGLYSLVARTNQSIAAFAVQVMDSNAADHLPTNIEVRIIRSAGEKIKEIIRSQTVPTSLVRVDSSVAANVDPLAAGRRFAGSSVVRLDKDGNLQGQLARSGLSVAESHLKGMSVYVLKDGEEVARREVDADGHFTISGLTEGAYGFIAAGSNGFVATSFQVLDATVAQKNSDGKQFVGLFHKSCPQLNCEVVDSCEVVTCEIAQICETIVEVPVVEVCEAVVMEPAISEVIVDECGIGCGQQSCGCGGGFGGYGGGGGGFGGGGFGGGGFGGNLLGIAGLAGVAAAVANNDNNNGGGFIINQPNNAVMSPIQ